MSDHSTSSSWSLQPFKAHVRPFYFILRKLWAGQLNLRELAYAKQTYYSQFGEDVYLQRYFAERDTGFYVDVGAFHPYSNSNTYAFYKRGWRGINVEPNPASFRSFPKHRPRDINLDVAVSSEEAEVVFNCMENVSGIDGETHLFRERPGFQAKCMVRTVPLSKILETHLPPGTQIDFMSVDCEGHDQAVLLSNDWTRFRPSVMVVEDHHDGSGELEGFFESVGYRFDRKLELSKVFVEKNLKV